MLDLTVILIGALTFILAWKILKPSRVKTLIDKIPGPPGYPIVGNMFQLIKPTDGKPKQLRNDKELGWFANESSKTLDRTRQ